MILNPTLTLLTALLLAPMTFCADADKQPPPILTPKPSPKPRINGAKVFGVWPGHPILDTIPPVGPLDITIRLPRKPATVTIEPGARPLACDYRDGQLRLTVPKVEIHEIVAVQAK